MSQRTRFYGMAVVLISLQVSLQIGVAAAAVDLDVKSARDRYERQRRIADAAQNQAFSSLQKLQTAQSSLSSAQRDETESRRRLANAQSELQNIDSTIGQLERDLNQLNADIRDGERKLSTSQSDARRLELDISDLEFRREALIRRIETLNAAIALLEGNPDKEDELAAAKHRRAGLISECDDVDRQLSQARSRLASINNDCRTLQHQIDNCRTEITQKNYRIAECERQRITTMSNISEAKADLRRAQDAVAFAQRDVQISSSQYISDKNSFELEDQEADRLYAYYQQVKNNYTVALNEMYRKTEQSAQADSRQEAVERATEKGKQDGIAGAGAAGNLKGTQDGNTREHVRGYFAGKAGAETDPTLVAFHQSGADQGQNLATQKALSENFPVGFNDALKLHFSGAPANALTVDISEQISSASGGSGNFLNLAEKPSVFVTGPFYPDPKEPLYTPPTYSTPGVNVPATLKTHYSPPCTGLAVPEFEGLCLDRYEATYHSGFDANYQAIYRQGYKSLFESAVGEVYQSALAKSYPASLAQGRQRGATEQGIMNGFSRSLKQAQATQYQAGQSAFRQDLAQGAVVIVRGASIEDTSGDGLLTPGEPIKVTLVVDNYGLEATARAKARLAVSGVQGLGTLNFLIRDLPALQENTRTTLTGVVAGPVTTEFVGEKIGLKGNIEIEEAGKWKVLGSVQPLGETHFPLELSDITLPKNPAINEELIAVLKFTNQTKLAFPAAKLKFNSRPLFVAVPKPEADIPELAAGATVDIPMAIKPTLKVPQNSYVRFVSELELADGRTMAQSFGKYIQMTRNTSISLFDGKGQPVPSSTVKVKAGTLLPIQAKLNFHAKSGLPGPFQIRTSSTSNPLITIAGGSTTKIQYGPLSPGSTLKPMPVFYTIPAALKGRKEFVMLQADEGAKANHELMVYLDIE